MLTAAKYLRFFYAMGALHECDNQMGNSNISDHTFFFVCVLIARVFSYPNHIWRRTQACFIFYGLFIWEILTRFIEYWKITERVLSDRLCCRFFIALPTKNSTSNTNSNSNMKNWSENHFSMGMAAILCIS